MGNTGDLQKKGPGSKFQDEDDAKGGHLDRSQQSCSFIIPIGAEAKDIQTRRSSPKPQAASGRPP